MNYKKIISFIILFLIFLPNIVKADGGVALLVAIGFMIPLIIILSFAISLSQNILTAYITIRFIYKGCIKNTTNFIMFIVKCTIAVGIIEVILFPITFLVPSTNNFLIFTLTYSIFCGITIFFIFRQFFPRNEIKMEEHKINNCAFLMSILTNPLIVLLIIYSWGIIK